MTFLPTGYQKPASNSKYLKFQQGDNHFRILSDAIVGYLDWKEELNQDGTTKRVPVRTREQQPAINPSNSPKHFWSFVVWDYREGNIKIMELTQASIQGTIYNYHMDENWGDPKRYDVNIKKTGEKMETRYSVMAMPPKELSPEIAQEYSNTKVDLNKLYENGDPFEFVGEPQVNNVVSNNPIENIPLPPENNIQY